MTTETNAGPASGSQILIIILSILLPPLGVALSRGIGTQFLINILLTILGYVPGLVHAIWLAARPAP
ncbi:YqaE/Pmp3 family membrane protein [Henriciella aquimarina]|uniref:YqaE/Pmp3 family membrane protein n=1 Tax=Henriciella aquimarina TaxID=545261 RepID=UPI000A0639ED|nr:YqaE/Pmp3 family membrane protein [Henriciella aquimarina]